MVNSFKSKDKTPPFRFTCSCCGKEHEGLPAFTQRHPPYYLDVPEDEREERTFHNNDFCVVDDEYFFIRVTFHLPIIGHGETFEYGMWASQGQESFQRYNDTFKDDQSGMGSYGTIAIDLFGWKRATDDDYLEDLPCNVEWQGDGQRPYVILHESDHPLYLAQQEGITEARAIELAEGSLHD